MATMAKPIATLRSVTGISTGKLAIWWVLASEIVIFGGLLAAYLMHRMGHPEFGNYAAYTNTWIGGLNTMVLLTSSYFAVRAHFEAEHGRGKEAAKWLYYTVGGALAFLCIKSYEWHHEIHEGFTITRNAFWAFYYTAAGLHGCHVIGGAIIMLIIAQDAKKNQELQRVELIGIYWHFVDVVWIFLFPLLYIAK